MLSSKRKAFLNLSFSILPKSPKSFITQHNQTIFNFMWRYKQRKLARQTINKPIIRGGEYNSHWFLVGLKFTWVRRYINASNSFYFWCSFSNFGKSVLFNYNSNSTDVKIKTPYLWYFSFVTKCLNWRFQTISFKIKWFGTILVLK